MSKINFKATAFRSRAVVVSTWWTAHESGLRTYNMITKLHSQKVLFVRWGGGGGSNFDNVFLVDDGREDPNTIISGPSLARQRNTI